MPDHLKRYMTGLWAKPETAFACFDWDTGEFAGVACREEAMVMTHMEWVTRMHEAGG